MPNLYEPYPFNLQQERLVWDDLIKRYGDLAMLRQQGRPDRWCSAMQASMTPAERIGRIGNPTDRRMLISALAPDTGLPLDPEPTEKDLLVTLILNDDGSPVLNSTGKPEEDDHFRMYAPPGHAGPSRKQLYWRFDVRA
jgi:hypothetical protein